MTPPTSYTEATLKAYMHSCLGPVATELAWSVAGGSYDEPVNSALLEYGQTDISLCTDIPKIRALARYAVWFGVVQAVTTDHVYDATGALKPSKFHDQALKSFSLAYADALQYLSHPAITITPVRWTEDPYVRTE